MTVVSELWLGVVGWDELQHSDATRGSGPLPWVKNYTRWMNSDGYLSLSPNRVAIFHRLLLEYASSSARVRADTRWLTRRLFLRVTTRDLEALEQAGLIGIRASIVHAHALHDARLARAEVEVEVEKYGSGPRGPSTQGDQIRPDSPADLPSNNKHDTFEGEPGPGDGYGAGPLDVAGELENLRNRWAEG